jgi:hypothetical protein
MLGGTMRSQNHSHVRPMKISTSTRVERMLHRKNQEGTTITKVTVPQMGCPARRA